MRDIAAASGVSQSTVSRVLSGVESRIPIAAETRERILEAARSLGYRPNPLARGLRGASTNLIGAVVRDFSDPFFAEAIEALVVESMWHGYNVVLGHVQDRLNEAVLLTSVLGIRPTASRRELNIVNPALPHFMDQLSIRNLRIGGSRVGLDFTRRGERTFCNVVEIEGDKLLVNVAFKTR